MATAPALNSVTDNRGGWRGEDRGPAGQFALSPLVPPAVGAPISPGSSRVQVDALHAIYVELLTQLFEEHKEPFGVPADRHLLLT